MDTLQKPKARFVSKHKVWLVFKETNPPGLPTFPLGVGYTLLEAYWDYRNKKEKIDIMLHDLTRSYSHRNT